MEKGRTDKAFMQRSLSHSTSKQENSEIEYRLEFQNTDSYIPGRSFGTIYLTATQKKLPNGLYENIGPFKAPWTGTYRAVPSKFFTDSPITILANNQILPEQYFDLKAGESIYATVRCDRESKISDIRIVDVKRKGYFDKDWARSLRDLYCLVSCTSEYPCYIYVYGTKK